MTTDQLARALVELASDGVAGGPAAVDRLAGIDGRAEGLRRWRTARRTMTSGVLAAVALAAFLLVPVLLQPHGTTDAVKPAPDRTGPVVERPPPLVGFPLPLLIRVNDVPYQYYRSEQSLTGRDVLRVAVGPSRQPQALAWATSYGQPGLVLVNVDGNTVSRHRAGGLASTILLSPRRTHLVVIRATQPISSTMIGLAIYRWPSAHVT